MSDIYDLFSIKGKRVLISGAGNGNGAVFARAFADAGAILTLSCLVCTAEFLAESPTRCRLHLQLIVRSGFWRMKALRGGGQDNLFIRSEIEKLD